jgi:undecaprenyl-diphosphatase
MQHFIATVSSLDANLLNLLRSWIDPDLAWLSTAIHLFADIEVAFAALFLVGLWLFAVVRSSQPLRREALLLFWSIAVSFAVYVVLNLGLPMRTRPETILAIAPVIDHLPDNSFPSGHAIFASASAFGALFFVSVRRGLWVPVFFVLGILMCLARIFAGVHYPLDIAAGWVVGSVGPFIVSALCARPAFDRVFVAPIIRLAGLLRL